MCGICGIVNFNTTEPVDRGLVERMTSAQAHRGPDDHGYFVENNVGLGHRRLSIIDLSGGKQPILRFSASISGLDDYHASLRDGASRLLRMTFFLNAIIIIIRHPESL